jgi:hypothetical protein
MRGALLRPLGAVTSAAASDSCFSTHSAQSPSTSAAISARHSFAGQYWRSFDDPFAFQPAAKLRNLRAIIVWTANRKNGWRESRADNIAPQDITGGRNASLQAG